MILPPPRETSNLHLAAAAFAAPFAAAAAAAAAGGYVAPKGLKKEAVPEGPHLAASPGTASCRDSPLNLRQQQQQRQQ